MRKIFLTSGLVLCMACPAFADLGPNNKVMNESVNPPVETDANATCQQPTLEGYTGTSTFTAIWNANQYAIKYYPGVATAPLVASNPHTVSGSETTQTVTFDASVTLKDNTAADLGSVWAQTGYTFGGWRADHNILTNTATALSNNNTAGGYMYLGGATNDSYSGGGQSGTSAALSYKVPGETKMYAMWEPNKSGKITLNSSVYPSNNFSGTAKYTTSNGVHAVSPDEVFSVYETALYDWASAQGSNPTVVQSFTPPTKDGYTFNGFFESDGTTQVITDAGAIVEERALRSVSASNGEKTWYAKWTPIGYTITYTCGTKPTGASTDFTSGHTTTAANNTNDTDSVTFDTNYTLNADAGNCELLGYHFVGWKCENLPGTPTLPAGDGVQHTYFAPSASANYNYADNVTCDAVWEANNITTTWNLQGGSATQEGLSSCTYDSTIGLPQGVTKTGYTFGGWTVTNTNP